MFNYILNIHIMNIRKIGKILILVSVISVAFCSCIIDTKPLGYCVRNCTRDTLLIDVTKSDTLDNEICWGKHSGDTIELDPEDTIGIYVHGEKVIFFNFFYALPDSTAGGIYPFGNDTCYIYAIKWQIAKHYTLEEIRAKKLYDRRGVTKNDFNDNRIFEYRPAESARSH